MKLRAERFLSATETWMEPLQGTHIHAAARRDRLSKLGHTDPVYALWMQALLRWLGERLGRSGGIRMLDYGCGTGELTVLAHRLGSFSVGVDLHRDHLTLARILASENGMPPARLLHVDGLRLPFGEAAFDVAHLHVVLEHMSDSVLDGVLPELRRTCAAVHVIVPNRLQFIDDHTGLPGIPLLPRPLARLAVRLSGRGHGYGISHSGEWDVWYRGFKSIRRRFALAGFELSFPPDDVVFPPLESEAQVPLTSYAARSRVGWKRLVWRLLGAAARLTLPRDAPSVAALPYLNLLFVPTSRNAGSRSRRVSDGATSRG